MKPSNEVIELVNKEEFAKAMLVKVVGYNREECKGRKKAEFELAHLAMVVARAMT